MAPAAPTAPAAPRASARFTEIPRERGHYESFYLKAGHPTEPLAVWVRYTIHKRPGAEPTGSLWFTLFDRAAGRPQATKLTLPADRLDVAGDDYLRIGEARIGPRAAVGAIEGEPLAVRWELAHETAATPLRHLPREWMYRAPVPRTKLESPHPDASFSGRITVAGQELLLDRWPGMVGHNWGREHAERWIWLHGTSFDEAPGSWLDIGLGRVKLGPVTTPWIGNGRLVLDGTAYRLGGIERVRATRVVEAVDRCELELPGDGVHLRALVDAPRENLVGWIYADPDGSEHNTVNCSIAALTLEVARDRGEARRLQTRSGGVYELGMRERDHGVPLEPFADG